MNEVKDRNYEVRDRKYAMVFALGAGFVFGTGLWLSGMANPRKVLDFLDVTGRWDASLLLVMGGAVAVTLAGFRFVVARGKPLFEDRFDLPAKKDLDLPLIAGSALFGAGWGIAGYCPGPAVTALSTLSADATIFFVAMLAGGYAHKLIAKS